jgi:hypothetical protein
LGIAALQRAGWDPRLLIAIDSYTKIVYTIYVKNITLSAEEHLIDQARSLAKSQHKTLNSLFREWLHQLTTQHGETQSYDALMQRLGHVRAGRHFSRDEMNER